LRLVVRTCAGRQRIVASVLLKDLALAGLLGSGEHLGLARMATDTVTLDGIGFEFGRTRVVHAQASS
jgi:hypothetical protein